MFGMDVQAVMECGHVNEGSLEVDGVFDMFHDEFEDMAEHLGLVFDFAFEEGESVTIDAKEIVVEGFDEEFDGCDAWVNLK